MSAAEREAPGAEVDAPDAEREAARDDEVVAVDIRQVGQDRLGITWSDGRVANYPVRALRQACPCAHCVDEMTGKRILDPDSVPEDIRPTRLEGVGRYAIRIHWSDSHNLGLYSFRLLRQLEPGDLPA